jgi:hypothetical protein
MLCSVHINGYQAAAVHGWALGVDTGTTEIPDGNRPTPDSDDAKMPASTRPSVVCGKLSIGGLGGHRKRPFYA